MPPPASVLTRACLAPWYALHSVPRKRPRGAMEAAVLTGEISKRARTTLVDSLRGKVGCYGFSRAVSLTRLSARVCVKCLCVRVRACKCTCGGGGRQEHR